MQKCFSNLYSKIINHRFRRIAKVDFNFSSSFKGWFGKALDDTDGII